METHYEDYRFLLEPQSDQAALREDQVLPQLQGKAFQLSPPIQDFLTTRYTEAASAPIPSIRGVHASPDASRSLIKLHRRMLRSQAYVQSRIDNPTTGTMDHLHAELVARIGVEIARSEGYDGDAVEAVRLAAHLHDSDRSFPELMTPGEQAARSDPEAYRRFKALHMANSAARTRDLVELARESGTQVSADFLHDVAYIVSRHEVGGARGPDGKLAWESARTDPSLNLNELTDIVKDADSISYFEAALPTYWSECGKSEARMAHKIHYMFDRMSDRGKSRVLQDIVLNPRHPLGEGPEPADPDLRAVRGILRSHVDLRLTESQKQPFLDSLKRLQADSPSWEITGRLPLKFETFHPQGLVKVGDEFYLSSVEVREPPKRQGETQRTPGQGVGHLFKFDSRGNLLADVELGEQAIYHPGGIDYDGHSLWVPVGEYRPQSRSIVYKVDPQTMKASEAFRVADHIGAVAFDTDRGTLHGTTWGSQEFYEWTQDGQEVAHVENAGSAIEYQDCKFIGDGKLLCSGLKGDRGGLELVDADSGSQEIVLPLDLRTPERGTVMTQNPMSFRFEDGQPRFYFVPEDSTSELYTVEPA